jgi:hypothetical protein
VIRTPDWPIPATTTIASLFIELKGGMSFRFDMAGLYNRRDFAA